MASDQTQPDKAPLPGGESSRPSGEVPLVVPSGPPVEPDPSQLTPEEQMARFAKELQEKDWGHQPC